MSEVVKSDIVLPEISVAEKDIAEMIGTMVLVLLGCGSAVLANFSGIGALGRWHSVKSALALLGGSNNRWSFSRCGVENLQVAKKLFSFLFYEF